MAFELHRGEGFPAFAASNIAAKRPVTFVGGDRQVTLCASNNLEPLGFTHDAAATQGDAIAVHERGAIVKAVAAASLGAAADVGVASTNGAIGPVSGASGITRWRVGKSAEAAAAGETFSVYVSPHQLSNLI
jgi:hypothetical protein